MKLKVNSKDLKNEEIVTDLAEYQHYVYVSKAVTITTTGKSVTVDKPLKAGTGTTSVAAEDITLSLQVGWNTFYESYDFEDGTYTIVRDELDHWVYYNN